MSPGLRAWMHPDDLILYQLDLLPWPAYSLLVERYFVAQDYRVKPIASEPGRSEFLLVSSAGVRHLLHCCSVQAAKRLGELEALRSNMSRFRVQEGVLASPTEFTLALTKAARSASVELYSGNRLRAKIESLPAEKRRAVLDSIRPKPERAEKLEQGSTP